MECGAEGRLGDGLDREELIRKRAIFRVVLAQGVSAGCAEGRRAYLEFEADTIRFRDVQELDELAPDTVHLLDVVFRPCPELDTVDLRAETDNGAADLVALVELLTNERHRKPLPALIERRRVVVHRERPLPAIRLFLVLPHRFYAQLEQVVVRVRLQFGWRLQPVEVPVSTARQCRSFPPSPGRPHTPPNRLEPDMRCQWQSWACRAPLPWCRDISSCIEVN